MLIVQRHGKIYKIKGKRKNSSLLCKSCRKREVKSANGARLGEGDFTLEVDINFCLLSNFCSFMLSWESLSVAFLPVKELLRGKNAGRGPISLWFKPASHAGVCDMILAKPASV